MRFEFYFSPKITIIAVLLMLVCARLSYWQWERHLEKVSLIQNMETRMRKPITPISEIIKESSVGSEVSYRRVHIEGEYDFQHEMVLKNRRLETAPGMFALTPLKIKNSNDVIIVSRGFIPFLKSGREERKIYQNETNANFIGLLKESMTRSMFAAKDPEAGEKNPWVDEWLRADIEAMQKQLPYKVLPFYVEVMGAPDSPIATSDIVNSHSSRNDIFNLASHGSMQIASGVDETKNYPVPVFDSVIPPGRHYGYVFEWAWIGLGIGVIAFLLQLKKPLRV